MEETQTDVEDNISLEDTLESLKRNANAVDVHLQEARKKLKAFQHKIAEESSSLDEVPLQPRTRMMKWLTDRHLPVESTFVDFFEVFIEEHKKENRLDISKRTVYLNTDASILFGYRPPHIENVRPVGDLRTSLNNVEAQFAEGDSCLVPVLDVRRPKEREVTVHLYNLLEKLNVLYY